MTNKEILEKFGSDYIAYCYKHTIEMFPRYLPDKSSFTEQDMKEIYACAVEQSLADFLYLFDQKREEYSIVVHHENGDLDVVAQSDGVVGELYGDNGWIARYSQDC